MIETFILALVGKLVLWIQADSVAAGAVAVWLITFLTGEGGGILVLTYAFDGLIEVQIATICVFLGSLCADLFWYGVTVSTLRPILERRVRREEKEKPKRLTLPVFEFAKKHPYAVLLMIKFLFGLRLALTIYISSRKDIPFTKYLICNIVANILFVGVLLGISFLIHSSVGDILDIKNNVFHALSLVVFIVIGSQFLMRLGEATIARFLSRKNT